MEDMTNTPRQSECSVLEQCERNECIEDQVVESTNRLKAFSLTEILIVLAIIGIMVMLVLPDQSAAVSKARAMEAKQHLQNIFGLQRAYQIEFAKYGETMQDIGYKAMPNAVYKYELTAVGPTSFTAQATATQDFNGDGTFNVWTIDQDGKLTEVTPD